MEYSKECLKLAAMCWSEDEQIMATSVRVGHNYEKDGVTYKIRLSTVDELYKYQEETNKKFKITRLVDEKNGDVINLIGVHGAIPTQS